MRFIRFVDDQGNAHFGCDYVEGNARVLEGSWPDDLRQTDQRLRVQKLLAPIEPRAILCIGLNYKRHADETGKKPPERPLLFMKNPAAVAHPGDPIVLPRGTAEEPEVDYEVELAVVIGRQAKNVPLDKALAHVWGYTVGNDVSARRWQKQLGGGQWVRGKSFDTFCPLGPVLVTRDEIPDPQTLPLRTILNTTVMQNSNTADMIFPVARLISELSQDMTLLPGTVLLTGTPEGVGFARKPPVFLKPGDTVTCVIDGIGELSNPVQTG